MSFNGSGTFVINSAGQPVVANTVISATVFNALTSDLATGLSTCITKDGQTTVTANIPFGSNKITGLGAGTVATDAANLGQVQSTAAKLITVTGTDTITGTMSPVLTAYAAGQLFYFISNGTNTGAMTINIDGLGAKAITRDGSTALIAGDVVSGEIVVICYDGTRFQMINAANSFGNTTINGTLTVTGDTALQANVSVTSALTVNGTFGVTGAATLGSTLSVTGKSDLPTVSTASMNAAVAVVTTGTVTNLTSTSASIASMNAGVALLTTATVTTLTASGASIASANIGNLQFTAASIASINAGVAVINNLTATSASIASANVGTAVITTGTVTNLTSTAASVASANAGVALITTGTVTNLTSTSASIASANVGTAVITTGTLTNLTATSASVASANLGVALVTTGTVTNLTSTGASIASANLGNAVISSMTLTGASVASVNVGTATITGNLTLSGGTANGVLYLDGSKVATSGSALTFDGSTLKVATSTSGDLFVVESTDAGAGAAPDFVLYRNSASPAASDQIGNIVWRGKDSGGADQQYARILTQIIDPTAGSETASWQLATQSSDGFVNRYVINENRDHIWTVASEAMRLTSTGLGIGTSSPAYKVDARVSTSASIVSAVNLDASGNSNGDGSALNFSRAGNALSGVARISAVKAEVSNNETDLVFSNYAAGSLTEKMRIVGATGNVGIGTSSPETKFVVSGSGSEIASLVWNTSGSSTNTAALYLSAVASGPALNRTAAIKGIIGTSNNHSLAFFTNPDFAAPVERMRITSAGDVGIGTSSPAQIVEASKSQDAKTQIKITNVNAGANASAGVLFGTSSGDNGYVGANGGAASSALGGANALQVTNLASAPVVIATNNTERMRIDSSGSVGIGGTAGASEKVAALGTYPSSGGNSFVFSANGTIPSSSSINGINFFSVGKTQAASFTLSALSHFYAQQGTFGAGSTVTSQYGFYVESSLTGATNNYGFYSNIASGSNRWNFYAAGTAQNYFAGNTGVGVSPTYRLQVDNSSASTGTDAFVVQNSGVTTNGHTAGMRFRFSVAEPAAIRAILTDAASGAGALGFYTSSDGTGANLTERMRIISGGEVYIAGTTDQGAYNLQCNGTGVWGAGAYVNGSDARLKDDITTLNDGLNVVSQLRPVTFKYKPDYSKDQNVQTGFIAQELQAVLAGKDYVDGIVQAGPNHLNVAYQSLIPIMVKAIQELTARVAELEAK